MRLMTGTPTAAGPVHTSLLRAGRPAQLQLAVALAVLAAAAATAMFGSAAAGGVAAFFGAGLLVTSIRPGLAAPFLALATPLGYWHPHMRGVQVPSLEAASIGAALGCLPGVIRFRGRPVAADIAFAALLGGILLSGAGTPPRGQWTHNVVLWGSLTVVFVAAHRSMRARRYRVAFLAGIGVAGLAEAVIALVQYVQGSSGRFSHLGGAIVYPQPTGTLENPNALAPYLVVCVLLLAGAALAERAWRRAAVFIVAGVIGIGSLVPYSRGGWISLATGALAWSGAQRRTRSLIATAAVLAATLTTALVFGGTFGARLSSLASRKFSDLYGFRLTLAERAVHIIVHHPLTGTGVFHEIGTYAGRPSLATHPHDLLLGVAVFFGIPSALAFLAVLIAAGRGALRAVVDDSGRLRAEGAGAIAALVAIVIDGFLEYPFWNSSLTVLIVTVFAYAVSLGYSTDGIDVPGSSRARRRRPGRAFPGSSLTAMESATPPKAAT
jgi:hypothetical protein